MEGLFLEVLEDEAALIARWKAQLDEDLKDEKSRFIDPSELDIGLRSFLRDLSAGSFESWKKFVGEHATKLASNGAGVEDLEVIVASLRTVLWDYAQEKWAQQPTKALRFLKKSHDLIGGGRLEMAKVFINLRQEIITKQQLAIMELSTPVIPLFDNILVVPLIGTIDTARANQILENILQGIAEHEAEIVIIDVTGLPIVDTNVAHHLLKASRAAKLLGAQCIFAGMRPEVAQTIINLEISFRDVITRNNLAQGIEFALKQLGLRIVECGRTQEEADD